MNITSKKSKGGQGSPTVFNFFRQQISQLKDAGREQTAAHYLQTLSRLMSFRNGKDLRFNAINPLFTLSYETWMRNQHMCRNTTSFYMRILRSVYNKAVTEGITANRHPFCNVYTGVDKTTKRALTRSDMARIKRTNLRHSPCIEFARDMFILSFYLRGISPIDLSYLRKTDICQGYVYYSRSKTGQQMQIRIVPDIQRILDKYSDTHTQYLLPLIKREDGTEQKQYRNSTQAINRNLKKLAERLQLSSPLTLYVARHSWASIAQSFNVPINVISGAMGHDSETTTQIYLASIQTSKIDEANSLIIDSI